MKFFLALLMNFSFLFICAQSQIGGDIDGEAAGDQSGNAVSISSDPSEFHPMEPELPSAQNSMMTMDLIVVM